MPVVPTEGESGPSLARASHHCPEPRLCLHHKSQCEAYGGLRRSGSSRSAESTRPAVFPRSGPSRLNGGRDSQPVLRLVPALRRRSAGRICNCPVVLGVCCGRKPVST